MGEEKRPEGTCGGVMDEAKSESGKTWGFVCRTCGASLIECEACGDLFKNMRRHLFDSKTGEPRECYAKSPQYRTSIAAQNIGKGNPV